MNSLICTVQYQSIFKNINCSPEIKNVCTWEWLSSPFPIYITSSQMMAPISADDSTSTYLRDLFIKKGLIPEYSSALVGFSDELKISLQNIQATLDLEQADSQKPNSQLEIIHSCQGNSCSCPPDTSKHPQPILESIGEFKEENVIEDFALGKFMRFLKRIGLKKLLAKIKDRRDPKKIEYKIEIILQWALTVFFFRCESTNALQTAFEKLPTHRRRTLWNYFGLDPEKTRLPHRTIVTDCLSLIDQNEINHLLEQLFKWALKSKIFYNHMGTLVPDFTYHLACDGVWVHTYTHPHSVDEEGKNICPYCLPRVHNKGKKDQYIDYLHAFVNLAFILPGGIQLPIYVYALKEKQLKGHEAVSAEKHKQECELQAAHAILPLIKKQFPRLSITLITDSLYANEPLIKLCKELGWEFLIVRQEGSLKKVAEQCNKLEKTDLYKTDYTSTEIVQLETGGKIIRKIKWFNGVRVGDETVHIIRFEEIEYNANGSIAKNAKGQEKRFKTEWLSSIRVRKENCFRLAKRARMRADHEDEHNTLKRRGFAAKHDYARANPNACLIWKLLMFVAFWIFELFSCTKLAQESRGSGSWMALARELLSDLQKIKWSELRRSPSLQQEHMQFRYNFSP